MIQVAVLQTKTVWRKFLFNRHVYAIGLIAFVVSICDSLPAVAAQRQPLPRQEVACSVIEKFPFTPSGSRSQSKLPFELTDDRNASCKAIDPTWVRETADSCRDDFNNIHSDQFINASIKVRLQKTKFGYEPTSKSLPRKVTALINKNKQNYTAAQTLVRESCCSTFAKGSRESARCTKAFVDINYGLFGYPTNDITTDWNAGKPAYTYPKADWDRLQQRKNAEEPIITGIVQISKYYRKVDDNGNELEAYIPLKEKEEFAFALQNACLDIKSQLAMNNPALKPGAKRVLAYPNSLGEVVDEKEWNAWKQSRDNWRQNECDFKPEDQALLESMAAGTKLSSSSVSCLQRIAIVADGRESDVANKLKCDDTTPFCKAQYMRNSLAIAFQIKDDISLNSALIRKAVYEKKNFDLKSPEARAIAKESLRQVCRDMKRHIERPRGGDVLDCLMENDDAIRNRVSQDYACNAPAAGTPISKPPTRN